MQLLVEDEDHLETDPAKVTERLTPAQQERFGEKGSEGYKQRVQAAVEANEAKLVALVNKFIGYLKQNTYCFPHSLRWIVCYWALWKLYELWFLIHMQTL